jgi:hypothetical protein
MAGKQSPLQKPSAAFVGSNMLLARLSMFYANRGDRVMAALLEQRWQQNQKEQQGQ